MVRASTFGSSHDSWPSISFKCRCRPLFLYKMLSDSEQVPIHNDVDMTDPVQHTKTSRLCAITLEVIHKNQYSRQFDYYHEEFKLHSCPGPVALLRRQSET